MPLVDGGNHSITLYLNGFPVSGQWISGNGSRVPVVNDCLPVIGNLEPNSGYSFRGTMDEIRVYNKALTLNEVQEQAGRVVNVTYAKNYVDRLYRVVLGRAPDTGGFNLWTNALLDGTQCGSTLAEVFFNSPEFNAVTHSDADFLTKLYRSVLNREPDAPGYAIWMGQLTAGSLRTTVLYQFTHSPEFVAICREIGILPYPAGG